MNGRNGPLSPVSVGGSEWSGISKYQNDSIYSPGPNNRGQLASPPISSGSNGSTMNGGGFPPRGSPGGSPGGAPSPPSSIARSSTGTGLYASSDNSRNIKDSQFEGILSEHYIALKRYLAASLRDEKGNPRPNRARDKLLRLSAVQFQELSTDVFDELLRRQQTSRRPPNGGPPPQNGPPTYLLAKDSFHPKRNQARQKLSTLPHPGFEILQQMSSTNWRGDFPGRMGSPASARGPPSRNGTPVNGGPRMRRPSEANSTYSMRSDSRGPGPGPRPPMNGGLGIPPSPGLPPNDYGRPTPKTFQSNTIVPNKSTMVEDDETGGEDNDDDDGDAFGLEAAARRQSKKSTQGSETDKKLIDDYQTQVAELRERLDGMEDNLKAKDDELASVLDQSASATAEKSEWLNLRKNLEDQVADVQNLNESLQSEIERVRADQANTERELRTELAEVKSSGGRGLGGDLEHENQELRAELDDQQRENGELKAELDDQQRITDEVRREAQEFLGEMRILSERSSSSYDREEQLSETVNRLEAEVKDWRNRYARTKTQLRGLRASSIGLTIQPNAAKYTKDSGFTQANGLIKDVHITKFQISIDEILQVARTDDPSRVIEFVKIVVVNVRRITQDIDEATSSSSNLSPQQGKLKSRVSATANNLITAAKNFASANGLSPVSILDAAASHLTAAVVELVRTVKIRPTPAGELEDDDDGNLAPVDSPGFFPVRDQRQENNLPAFQGLRAGRASGDSSMYSPLNSPRESASVRPRSSRGPQNGYVNGGSNKNLPPAPMGLGFGIRTNDNDVEELKIYLEDQTAMLVQNIQSLVSSIRSEAGIGDIATQIAAIADNVGKVVSSTETAMSSTGNAMLRSQGEPILRKLSNCRQRILDAGELGRDIADEGRDDEEGDQAWRAWNQSLPPIAFEIARETKELVLKVDTIDGGGRGDDDFS
ncbi:Protein SPA2 [Lachnellula subtilissima]|uniref:Protein SPA2 n=1 Tax=Lachnellula subtilissima TaxID=602034 RepID=A0A8H8RBM4_9HELO|nr:Protein SPA2 [Lachnellula subtilissima]